MRLKGVTFNLFWNTMSYTSDKISKMITIFQFTLSSLLITAHSSRAPWTSDCPREFSIAPSNRTGNLSQLASHLYREYTIKITLVLTNRSFPRTFVDTLISFPKLLIAAVNGPAIGFGAAILPLCDIVYASDKAYFHLPYSSIGMTPEGCSSFTYPHYLGLALVSSMLLSYLDSFIVYVQNIQPPHFKISLQTFNISQEEASLHYPIFLLYHGHDLTAWHGISFHFFFFFW